MRVALTIAVAAAVLATPACKGSKSPVTEDDKTLYAMGATLGQNLRTLNLTEAELAMVERGLEDQVLQRKLEVELKEYGPKLSQMFRARSQKVVEAEKQKGATYTAQVEKEAGAQKLPSGVIYIEQQAGTGEQPEPTSMVKVNYRGTLIDGTEFDSSYKRKEPAEFALNRVIPCWTQGVQKMKVGGKAKLVCPSDAAYGDRGTPGTIPGGSTLTFEVELLEVKAAPPPPPMPPPPTGPLGGPGAPPPMVGPNVSKALPAPPPPAAKTPPPAPGQPVTR